VGESFAFRAIGTRDGGVGDLLVPLLKLPELAPLLQRLSALGIRVRRARSYERSHVGRFVRRHFSEGWADEAMVSFAHLPVGCFIATQQKKIVGFAVVESTAPNFFGPTGVDPAERGKGIGTALLVAALHSLREVGYIYGIIGWAGPVGFYARTVHASPIEDSEPGIYSDILAPDPDEPPR
jgi:GNAT superfamily N-acetyltransferase